MTYLRGFGPQFPDGQTSSLMPRISFFIFARKTQANNEEHTAAQARMNIIDGESLEGDRRTKNVVAIRGKLILRKLGPRH